MTTDKQPQTFEEWFDSYCQSLPKDMWSLRDSWNAGRAARDAEIAELKRQVADGESRFADTLIWITREHEIELADARCEGAEEMRERAANVKYAVKEVQYSYAYDPAGNNQMRVGLEVETETILPPEAKAAIRALPLIAPAPLSGVKGIHE